MDYLWIIVKKKTVIMETKSYHPDKSKQIDKINRFFPQTKF